MEDKKIRVKKERFFKKVKREGGIDNNWTSDFSRGQKLENSGKTHPSIVLSSNKLQSEPRIMPLGYILEDSGGGFPIGKKRQFVMLSLNSQLKFMEQIDLKL